MFESISIKQPRPQTFVEQVEDALMDGPGTIAEIVLETLGRTDREAETLGRTDREAMAKVRSALRALEMRNGVDIWGQSETPLACNRG